MKTAKTYEIRIASPCSNDWEGMVGTERVRHCAQCDRDVHNFSAMTRREIDALLAARRGRLCGRYVQRADGSMVTRDTYPPAGQSGILLNGGVFEEPLQQAPAPQQSVVVGEIAPRQNSASKGDRKILVAKDATGAAIPQASVTLTNEKTGEVVKGETGPDGSLRVAKLKHGKYKVEIVHQAFRHATFDHVSLPAGKPPDYRLEVGAMMMGVVVITEGNPARRFFSRLWHKL